MTYVKTKGIKFETHGNEKESIINDLQYRTLTIIFNPFIIHPVFCTLEFTDLY